jgi:hypothetical protein
MLFVLQLRSWGATMQIDLDTWELGYADGKFGRPLQCPANLDSFRIPAAIARAARILRHAYESTCPQTCAELSPQNLSSCARRSRISQARSVPECLTKIAKMRSPQRQRRLLRSPRYHFVQASAFPGPLRLAMGVLLSLYRQLSCKSEQTRRRHRGLMPSLQS